MLNKTNKKRLTHITIKPNFSSKTMALPELVLSPDHEFCEAQKQIKTIGDFSKWEGSEAYQVQISFLNIKYTS